MSIQLGSAYGKIGLDIAGLLSGVTKGKAALLTMSSVGQQVGASMKNVGNMMTLGLTLPILALGTASIKLASDFEETKNKAVVVFEEMSDSVVANANKSATALGIGKLKYLDYASSIGAALKAGGMGIKEVTELSEGAVKHFADLASFHNAQVADVSVAWQSAIRGQFEPIQKYFPFITNQFLITFGTANGLIDANTKQLTANQRAIILNAIALNEELNPALNDFAETSGGLANQTRIAKEQFNDLLITLGQNFLPMATQLLTILNSILEKFNALDPTQQKILLGFMGMVAIAGPLLSALGTLVTVISSLAGFATTLSGMGISLGAIGATVSTVAVPAIAALGTALLPIIIILAAVAFYVGILYLMWRTNFLGMRDNVTMFVKIAKSLWAALTAFLRGDTDSALEHLGEAWEAFGMRLVEVFGFILNWREAWNNFLNFISNVVSKTINYLVNSFKKMDWSQIGKFVLMGIANGMLMGIPGLILAATKAVEAVLKTFDDKLDMHSPSGVMKKRGIWSALGFAKGWEEGMNPDDVAQMMAKPLVNNNSTQQQNITMQFSGGITTRQVQGMIAENNEQMMNTLINALGGAS